MSDLRRAIALMGSEQYAAALPHFESALRRSEQKPGGPSSAETAGVLDNIAECYLKQNEFRIAAEYYHRAAAISNYDIDDRITASLNASTCFHNMNDYAGAEKQVGFLLSVLDAEAAAGAIAPAVLKRYRAEARSYHAKTLQNEGRITESLPLLEENVAYYESIGDTQHLVDCLVGLGFAYFFQGLSEKALPMAQRAQSLNPQLSRSLVALSRLWTKLKRHSEALACAQKALDRDEREGGKNTPSYADIQLRIGTAFEQLGQYDESLSWFHRARTSFEKLKMTKSVDFGSLLNNIGLVYARTNNLAGALANYKAAEAIFRGALSSDDPIIVTLMRNIAAVNAALGNAGAASAAAASAAATARRSQVQCAAAGCPRKMKADGASLDQCGGCKRCYYCSKACQAADWKAGHKAECKTLRDVT